MHKYIERIIDVKGDGNYGYQFVSALIGKGKENHTLVRQQLIKGLKMHKGIIHNTIQKKEYFDAIHASLIPCVNGLTLEQK